MVTKLAHVCPVCGGKHIRVDWECTDNNRNWWWTGHYICLSCLTVYRASGPIRMGEPIVHAWHPACWRHGTDAVVISEQDNRHFYCVKCGCRMEVRDGRIITRESKARRQDLPEYFSPPITHEAEAVQGT